MTEEYKGELRFTEDVLRLLDGRKLGWCLFPSVTRLIVICVSVYIRDRRHPVRRPPAEAIPDTYTAQLSVTPGVPTAL